MDAQKLSSAIAARRNAPIQRSYLWRMILPDLTAPISSLNANISAFNRSAIMSAAGFSVTTKLSEDVSNRVTSLSVPFPSLETDKEMIGNAYYYYGKKHDIGNVSLSVLEYEDGNTFNYFSAWQSLIIQPAIANLGPASGTTISGTHNLPVVYKFPIFVVRMNTLKLDLYIDQYNGFFISNISDISSDYSTSGFLSYTVTLIGDEMFSRPLVTTGSVYPATASQQQQMRANVMSQALQIAPTFTGLSVGSLETLLPQLFDEVGAVTIG